MLLKKGSYIVSDSLHIALERPRHDVASRVRLQVRAEGLQAGIQARAVRSRQRRRHRHQGDGERTSSCTPTRCCSENTKIISFEPHLHAPGTRMCLEAIWGYNIQTLSCVGYDHNWVRGYSYADDVGAAAAEGHDPPHHRLHDNTPANKNVPDPRNWQGSGNRSIANMFIDLGNRVALTDEQFQDEMARARCREPRQGRHPRAARSAVSSPAAAARPTQNQQQSAAATRTGSTELNPGSMPASGLSSDGTTHEESGSCAADALALVVAPALAGAQSLSYNSGQNVAPGL